MDVTVLFFWYIFRNLAVSDISANEWDWSFQLSQVYVVTSSLWNKIDAFEIISVSSYLTLYGHLQAIESLFQSLLLLQ